MARSVLQKPLLQQPCSPAIPNASASSRTYRIEIAVFVMEILGTLPPEVAIHNVALGVYDYIES